MSGLLPPLSSRTSGGVSPYLLLLRVRGLLRRAGHHRFRHELPRVIRFVTARGPGLVRENVTRPGLFCVLGIGWGVRRVGESGCESMLPVLVACVLAGPAMLLATAAWWPRPRINIA